MRELTKLNNILYPKGTAFKQVPNGVRTKMHDGLNESFNQTIEDGRSTLDTIIPDNDNFTEEDASLLEYYYGVDKYEGSTLEQRKSAIYIKMSRSTNIPARQHITYLEFKIQEAGFDLYLYENTPPYQNPIDVIAVPPPRTQHADSTQHGPNTRHGGQGFQIVANSSNNSEVYNVGGNLYATFFVGGPTLGSIADVPEDRIVELRRLILKYKPSHLAAYLFINAI